MKFLLDVLFLLSLVVTVTGQGDANSIETVAVPDVGGTGELENDNIKTLAHETTAVQDVSHEASSSTLPLTLEATVCDCCYVCGTLQHSIFAEYCPCMVLTTDKCPCEIQENIVDDGDKPKVGAGDKPKVGAGDKPKVGAGDKNSVETTVV